MSVAAVSVLGCGWLGLPVAQQLVQLGYQVKGSTTTAGKKKVLRNAGIIPYVFVLNPDITLDIGDFFSSQILFLNIPYIRDLPDPVFYKEQVQSVVKIIERSSVRFVIFASSTSIYPETLSIASEEQAIDPQDHRAEVLLLTENLLRENKYFDTTILRFAGLYGGNRKIGGFLSGKKDLSDGDRPVNLVHLDDCVNIVSQVIERNIRKEIFNVCCDAHPSRRALYTLAAQKQGLPVPVFAPSSRKISKIVSNEKIKKTLNYQLKYPDPLLSI